MFIREQKIRKPNGKSYSYYSLVESVRKGKQVHKRVLANFGALSQSDVEKVAQRFAQLAGFTVEEENEKDSEIVGFKYFGIPIFIQQFMKILHLEEFFSSASCNKKIKFDLVAAFKVMLAAHLFKSGSRAELSVWDWQQKLFWHPHITKNLEYQHLLRSLPILVGLQQALEEHLHGRLVDLFSINVDLVFYDLTSSYVEGHGNWSEILYRGYSRDKRFDCKQIVIGLVVTREGFPVSWRVFEGNRLDQKTLEEMVSDLKDRFQVQRCIWVSDAGLLSKENLTVLRHSGYDYILGAGSGTYREVKKVLKKPDLRFETMADMKVCDEKITLELEKDEEVRCRAVLINSEGRRLKTAAILERRLQGVRDGFNNLKKSVASGYYKTQEEIKVAAEKVLHNSRVKKYFNYTAEENRFDYQEKVDQVQTQKDHAGRYALLTESDLELTDVINGYKTLLAVEDAFRVMKNDLDLRPLWHKCDDNLKGHVLLCVCSYLFFKMLDIYLLKAALPTTSQRALQAIKEIRTVGIEKNDGHEWRLMKVSDDTRKILEGIGVSEFQKTFKSWADNAPPYCYEQRLWPSQKHALENRGKNQT
jgi:transposase